jgi:uncharacterized protein YjbJ (UPF0337 family)
MGKAFGSERMQAEGALEKKEGDVQHKVGEIKRTAGQ